MLTDFIAIPRDGSASSFQSDPSYGAKISEEAVYLIQLTTNRKHAKG